MAEFNLAWQPIADINEIWDYLYELAGEQVADRYIERIYDIFGLLSEYPYLGRARLGIDLNIRSYSVPRTPYLVLYYPRDYGVEISRVFDSRRDLSDLFEGSSDD